MKIVSVHCMESFGECGIIAPLFLKFGSRLGEWASSYPALIPWKNSSTHWVGDWLDHRFDMDYFGESKNFTPSGIRAPAHLTFGLFTTLTTLSDSSEDALWLWVIRVYWARSINSEKRMLIFVMSVGLLAWHISVFITFDTFIKICQESASLSRSDKISEPFTWSLSVCL